MKPRPKKPRPEGPRPDPAPGNLYLVQAFVNTLDLEKDRDEIGSPPKLAAWMVSLGLLSSDAGVSPKQWQETMWIREGLRALLRARNGQGLNRDAVERLNVSAASIPTMVFFSGDGSLGIRSTQPGWPAAMARILDAAFEAGAGGHWERLKACQNPTCQWAFYDASSNRSAKWCTARRCGNRINTKSYRRRRAG